MTAALLLGIMGLALLDALNPATILGVALILLLPSNRSKLTASLFVLAAYSTVLVLGVSLYFAADAAADAITGGLVWLRRVAFGLAAIFLLKSAYNALRTRTRKAIVLPSWVRPATAAPLGFLMTGADLPNAFPYFIAIERLVTADISTSSALGVLALYSFVYCLPCMMLLLISLFLGDKVQQRLNGLYARFGTEKVVPRNIGNAIGYTLAAVAVAYFAITA